MLSADLIQEFLSRTEDIGSDPLVGAPFPEIADQWRALEVRPGDVIVLCLPNGKAMLEHFFGAIFSGAVPLLTEPNVPAVRLRELIRVMRARAAICVRRLPADFFGEPAATFGGARAYRFDVDGPPPASPGEVILLTSGTSGFATGCVHDVSSLLLNAERHAQSIGQRENDAVLVNLPLYFSFAMVAQALASLVRGSRLLIGGPPFHVPTYLKSLSQFSVTISSLTPVLIRQLIAGHLSFPASLRVLSVGGDSLPPPLVQRLLELHPGKELYLTYGLTQAGPRVSTLAAHAEPPTRYSSVGLPLAGTSVHLQPVPAGGGMQQLFVSSATVMKRRIGLLQSAGGPPLRPGTIATGDVFQQDQDGYLYFQGRLSDYIVRNGEKVCLAAIRRVAMGFPNVVRASTSVSKHEYGEDFDLVLHVDGSQDGYAEMLKTWLRRSEMPRSVRIVNNAGAPTTAYK